MSDNELFFKAWTSNGRGKTFEENLFGDHQKDLILTNVEGVLKLVSRLVERFVSEDEPNPTQENIDGVIQAVRDVANSVKSYTKEINASLDKGY